MTSTSFALSPNTAYTAHFVRPNFGYAETSYMLETLYSICPLAKNKKEILESARLKNK